MRQIIIPGGFEMPGRTYGTSGRYTFNGKELDKETGWQDYGMRIYDRRLGRFLSVDPMQKKFAYYGPYQFAGNTPIQATDLDGLEPKGYSTSATFDHPGRQWQKVSNEKLIDSKVKGKFYEMNVIDPDGAEFTVVRHVTERFDLNTRRIYEHSEFYYLNTDVNKTSGSLTLLDGDGNFKGNLTSFET